MPPRVLRVKPRSIARGGGRLESVGRVIAQLEQVFDVLRPSSRTVRAALHAAEKHGLPFWDSMVWAVAHENGLDEVLTEELPPRPQIEGVRYRNPFA